ncbi:MAG: Hsp20 family protein [Clostridia bacterium]|nr:Hsp20 family protein [Clostridia bacterium]
MKNNCSNYDLFDAFDNFFAPAFFERKSDIRANVKETDNGYEFSFAMPGFKKDEISVSLENGYLDVSGKKENKEENSKNGYLRREITETCERSFYVGDRVKTDDVKAKYENGILELFVPKEVPEAPASKFIAIE